jgi:uncharacterized coiled-coil DUF342 family protein
LKKQLSCQDNISADAKALRRELEAIRAESARQAKEIKSLTSSLQESQNECKVLSAKLTAARAQSEPPTSKVINSTTKARGTTPAAHNSVADRQLREELLSDLTGLIVRKIEKGDDGELSYDCLQTGKNGSK